MTAVGDERGRGARNALLVGEDERGGRGSATASHPAATARAMSSDESMPTGRPAAGETTTRCAVSCSAISCAACSSESSGRTTTKSAAATSPAVTPARPGSERAHEVDVGHDAPAVARHDDAVDRVLRHQPCHGPEVGLGRALDEPQLHGAADGGACEVR